MTKHQKMLAGDLDLASDPALNSCLTLCHNVVVASGTVATKSFGDNLLLR